MGQPQSRIGDNANVPSDAHGCPACPHNCTGPAVTGSPTVFVNSLPAVRHQPDIGVHAACCDGNMWQTNAHSGTVYINSKGAVRDKDATTHCGGSGKMIAGSPNVFTGG